MSAAYRLPSALDRSPTRRRAAGLALAIGLELLIILALLGTIVVGYLWGRSFIQRIFALTRVTRSIAEGKLETRVAISGDDEIRELGDAFNSMADRLVELLAERRAGGEPRLGTNCPASCCYVQRRPPGDTATNGRPPAG